MVDSPRARLQRVAAALRTLKCPKPSEYGRTVIVDDADAIFVADAIERRLAGKEKSLDRALGLARGPGNPGGNSKHLDAAEKIFWLWFGGKDFEEIGYCLTPADGLSDDQISDPGELKAILERNRQRIMEKLTDQLAVSIRQN